MKDLPCSVDVETLSSVLGREIYELIFDARNEESTGLVDCYVKGISNEEIDSFVQYWDERMIKEIKLKCEKIKDELELCRKYRTGECDKPSNCHWEHIPCSAMERCGPDCKFGHPKGNRTGPTRKFRKRQIFNSIECDLILFREFYLLQN